MKKIDPYETLGVARDASNEEVKTTFRRLARKYHPDAHSDDKEKAAEKFKEISAAYDILKDPQKRKTYDAGGFGFESMFDHWGFGDMFVNMNSTRSRQRPRGRDVRTEIILDLIDIVRGVEREVSYDVNLACTVCAGTGSTDQQLNTCNTCAGTGTVIKSMKNGPVIMSTSQTCVECNGSGSRPKNPCQTCSSTGYVSSRENFKVVVPPGIKDGDILMVRDRGCHGPSGNGNLLLVVRVNKHPTISRSGKDLFEDVHIPFTIALRGGKLDHKTITNDIIWVDIPKGCPYGHQIVFQGHGILDGSLMLSLTYKIPVLSEEVINKIAEFLPE